MGYDFIKENATVDDKGNARVSQKAFLSFMSGQGVTKEMMESMDNANRKLHEGMIQSNFDRLNDQADAIAADGGDPKTAKVKIVVKTLSGEEAMTSTVANTYLKPGTTERVTKPFVTTLRISAEKHLDCDMLTKCETEMATKFNL